MKNIRGQRWYSPRLHQLQDRGAGYGGGADLRPDWGDLLYRPHSDDGLLQKARGHRRHRQIPRRRTVVAPHRGSGLSGRKRRAVRHRADQADLYDKRSGREYHKDFPGPDRKGRLRTRGHGRLLRHRCAGRGANQLPRGFRGVQAQYGEAGTDHGADLALCRKELPDYMVPETVIFRDDLLRTSRGKIDYQELEKMAPDFKTST